MRDVIGRMRWGMMGGGYAGRYWKDEGIVWDMRDGPPPRNRPGRAAVFGPAPPQSAKNGKQERQTICDPKKRMPILYLTC